MGRVLVTAGCGLVIGVGVFGAAVKPDLLGAGAGIVDRGVYLVLLGFPVATIAAVWAARVRRH